MLAHSTAFGSRKDQDYPVSSAHTSSFYTTSTVSPAAMPQHGQDMVPPIAPLRRPSISSDRSMNGHATKAMNRNRKFPSILTQPAAKITRQSSKNMGAGTAIATGTGTPTTLTPRSASVRRKPVIIPAIPATTTTKIQYDVSPTRDRSHSRSNREQDDTLAVHMNCSQDNHCYHSYNAQSRGSGTGTSFSCEATSNGGCGTEASRLKRRISLNTPSGHTKNLRGYASGRNASSSFLLTNNPTSPTFSCNTSINKSTMNSHINGNSSDMYQDEQSYLLQQTKGNNVGQKFADFLGIGSIGSLGNAILGKKSRGSDTSIKGTSSSLSSSSSLLSINQGVSGVLDKKDASTFSNGYKTTLMSKMFSGQHHHSQAHFHSDSVVMESPRRNATEESRVLSWDMHNSMPPSGYEDEAFALWIRPNIQARTVISGADVENAEKFVFNEDPTCGDKERQTKYQPELEDMQILEEVLDFSIIILMRASASLYPFLAGAHSKSIPINIPWRALRCDDRNNINIRTLKEYQDHVMADIGCAIQAMIEIYDQQERPYSHPDNMGRDTKLQIGTKISPVVLPPHRSRLYMKTVPNVNSNGHTGLRPSATPSAAPLSAESVSPPKKHRRHSSTPIRRQTISGMITSIKQSLPSPMSLHPPQQDRSNTDRHNHPFHASYPNGTPFFPGYSTRSTPMSFTRAESTDRHTPLSFNYGDAMAHTTSSGNGSASGFFPQSIQSVLNSLRNNTGNTCNQGSHPYHLQGSSIPPVAPSRQEEKRQQMEYRWRVDITRRKAHLRGWACRRFLDLYHFSLATRTASLEDEFKDLYRIIRAIVEVNGDANGRSHDILASMIAEAHKQGKEPFKLKYGQYKTKAPTAKEIREANEEAAKRFEVEYSGNDLVVSKTTSTEKGDDTSMTLTLDSSQGSDQLQQGLNGLDHDDLSSHQGPSSAYDYMEFYYLQGHSIWEPLLDRLTKFDTTHHELDARNIFLFLRRMSLYSPAVADARHLLSDEARDEMLAVLWVLEKCVRERPDYQQSPTWFRLSSSPSAVQAVYNAGGVIPYVKELRKSDPNGRDPIQTVHPVTLTGYFKRLLKENGGLLLKEATALFVELARPATDNGDFWNLEKLSRIDRALLYRVICLDFNRGQVFLRISHVMGQILESSPKDMELDAFALSKMVQVVELCGVLDLKALRRWNGAWSAIILGYM